MVAINRIYLFTLIHKVNFLINITIKKKLISSSKVYIFYLSFLLYLWIFSYHNFKLLKKNLNKVYMF